MSSPDPAAPEQALSFAQRSWQERCSAAEEATEGKDWTRAAALWATLFHDAEYRDRGRAGRRAANAYRRAGDLERARDVMARLMEEMPDDALARVELARLHTAISRRESDNRYWHDRERLLYRHVVEDIALRLGSNASSIVDVGSSDTPLLESFPQVPLKISIDLMKPYRSSNVHSVQQDFLTWEPGVKFDVGVCLQVLEHVADPHAFAQHLLALFDVAIVSVPYRWEKGRTKSHIQDPVDEVKLEQWFQRTPNYSYKVKELEGTERLICIYDTTSAHPWSSISEEMFRFRWTLRGAEELIGEDLIMESQSDEHDAAAVAQLNHLQTELAQAHQAAADVRAQYQRLRNRRAVRIALRLAELARPLVRMMRRA